jgi:hypothetical protein
VLQVLHRLQLPGRERGFLLSCSRRVSRVWVRVITSKGLITIRLLPMEQKLAYSELD